MGCPNIWSNIIPDVSMRVFWGEINIWISGLSKADCLLSHGWASSNKLKA